MEIPGIRTSCIDGSARAVEVDFVRDGDHLLVASGGVTGCEGWYVTERFYRDLLEEGEFCICAGTPGVWDKLTVKHSDLRQVVCSLWPYDPKLEEKIFRGLMGWCQLLPFSEAELKSLAAFIATEVRAG